MILSALAAAAQQQTVQPAPLQEHRQAAASHQAAPRANTLLALRVCPAIALAKPARQRLSVPLATHVGTLPRLELEFVALCVQLIVSNVTKTSNAKPARQITIGIRINALCVMGAVTDVQPQQRIAKPAQLTITQRPAPDYQELAIKAVLLIVRAAPSLMLAMCVVETGRSQAQHALALHLGLLRNLTACVLAIRS